MVARGILFLIIWWLLTNGALSSWWFGIPAVLLATYTSTRLLAPVPFVLPGVIRFVPKFLLRSLVGGLDVAGRVFKMDMALAPDFYEYPLRLPPGLPQVVMTNTVGLLPGTLGAELDRNVLKVHVLDRQKDFLTELRAVEADIAGIFGIHLKNTEGDVG